MTGSLSFAEDERLSAREIISLRPLDARLVVASACQTAVLQDYEIADESLGLATAFIGAGAAGVIATLWSVDDYATALLMSRFYEILIQTGEGPAGALRAAQLWLRALTSREEISYVAQRRTLLAHRAAAGRGGMRRGTIEPDLRPYSAPNFWAPFTFTGG